MTEIADIANTFNQSLILPDTHRFNDKFIKFSITSQIQQAPIITWSLWSTIHQPHYRWTVKQDRVLSVWAIIGSPCIDLILHHSWRLFTTVYFKNVPSNCLIICWLKHKYYLSFCVENKMFMQNCAKSNSHIELVIFIH